MSGIVGIINLKGDPVNQNLLHKMTEYMAFRGPDGQDIWVGDRVGFGHAMLRTTRESLREHQPRSLDGQVWITADARVDARADLIQKLTSKGSGDLKAASDVELILHAYHLWGDDCLKHLIGDFSFAIWDGRRQCLFCARDHFGVKPFYYAQVGNSLVFSNTLNCVRIHPSVSEELDDLAIADFLMFGCNQNLTTTVFADIHRLPPAHFLTWSDGALHQDRHWTLPVDGTIRYKSSEEYADHFIDLLRTVVNDRIRTDQIAVFMSGGLDSTIMAVTANHLLSKQSSSPNLRAYTQVFDRLFPDKERYYSSLVANALGIPISYMGVDDYGAFERFDRPELRTPEPVDYPWLAGSVDQIKEVSRNTRVVLNGEGPDNALVPEWYPHISYLFKELQLKRLFLDVGLYFFTQRRLPFLSSIPIRFKRLFANDQPKLSFPKWLRKDFSSQWDLCERWKQLKEKPTPIHPIRPEAYNRILSPLYQSLWQSFFGENDPGFTSFPLEVRYPYMDIRMVKYFLAIPSIPWCFRKYLLRYAFKGLLPEEVRIRPKTPILCETIVKRFRHNHNKLIGQFGLRPELDKYIDLNAIPVLMEEQDSDQLWMNLRPFSLNYWFQFSAPFKYKS